MQRRPGSPHSKKRNPFPAENQHESFTDSLQTTAPSRFGRSSPSNRPRKRRGSGPSRFCVRTRLFSAGNRTRSSRLFKPSSAWSRPGIERPGPAVEMQNSHRKMVKQTERESEKTRRSSAGVLRAAHFMQLNATAGPIRVFLYQADREIMTSGEISFRTGICCLAPCRSTGWERRKLPKVGD